MKLKYHNNPIHIIATLTCKNLHIELQNRVSKTKPPLKKNNTKNNNIVNAKEKWIVFDKDDSILII